MRRAATVASALIGCAISFSAQAFSGGAAAVLIPKPGVTGDQLLKMTPQRRNETLARTVATTRFNRQDACRPGAAYFLTRRADGTAFFRMECAGGEAHLVEMPTEPHGAAAVRSCSRSRVLHGVDCWNGAAERAGRS